MGKNHSRVYLSAPSILRPRVQILDALLRNLTDTAICHWLLVWIIFFKMFRYCLFSVFFEQRKLFLQKILRSKKCPSSIQHRDSNPRPLDCESPPLTTIFQLHTTIILLNQSVI